MISAVENIYNIMENVHLRLFFIPKQSFRIKVGVLTVWRIRFSKGALDLIDETLYFNYYTTKSLDTLLVFPHFIRFPLL